MPTLPYLEIALAKLSKRQLPLEELTPDELNAAKSHLISGSVPHSTRKILALSMRKLIETFSPILPMSNLFEYFNAIT